MLSLSGRGAACAFVWARHLGVHPAREPDACSGDGVAPGEIDAPCSIKDLDNFRDSRLRPAPLSIERIVFSLIFLIPIIAKDIILAIDASA